MLEPIAYRVRWAQRRLLERLIRPTERVDLVRLGGADYGAWFVPENALVPGAVAYCAGAGEDIDFDLALLERGLEVVVFDPTPKAIAHIEKLKVQSPRFRFIPVGWWDKPDELRFYAPRNPVGVSHSALHLPYTTDDQFFTGKVDTPAAFAKRLGHDHVAVVKMDIEGAETRVLRHMMRHGPKPDALAVEFDDTNLVRVIREVLRLRLHGYRPAHTDDRCVTFVRHAAS